MSTTVAPPAIQSPPRRSIPERSILPLENGAQLSADEFMLRYSKMPELKKAELIDGEVYMGSPVSDEWHAEPDGIAQLFIGTFAARSTGVKHGVNSTVYLSPDDIVQPDGLLRLLPEVGGKVQRGEDGYLHGAPELVIEIAASSASIDARKKKAAYRRAGVSEYLLWRTEEPGIDWWLLENGEYQLLPADADGITRSRKFPGLWLDTQALLSRDAARVLDVLLLGLKSVER